MQAVLSLNSCGGRLLLQLLAQADHLIAVAPVRHLESTLLLPVDVNHET